MVYPIYDSNITTNCYMQQFTTSSLLLLFVVHPNKNLLSVWVSEYLGRAFSIPAYCCWLLAYTHHIYTYTPNIHSIHTSTLDLVIMIFPILFIGIYLVFSLFSFIQFFELLFNTILIDFYTISDMWYIGYTILYCTT